MHVVTVLSKHMGLPACCVMAALVLLPGVAEAGKSGRGADDSRQRYYGIIQAKPSSRAGIWKIGGREFTADRSTEFDEIEGPLRVGRCAKVDIRNGHVHEIDSEPMSDCE